MSVCDPIDVDLALPVEGQVAALPESPRAAASIVSSGPPMVLHVRVVTGQGGGPEKTILNSPRFLRRLGYDSKLAYLHPPRDPGFESIRQRGRALEAEVLSVPDRGPFDVSVIRRLIRICREEHIAIWHGHDYKSNALGLLVRWFHPLKLVTTLHGWTNLSGRVPLYARIDKWCLRHYEAAIAVSDDLLDACRKYRVPEQRRHLVYNAIDTTDYRRTCNSAEAKRRFGFDENGLLIGAVGRLSPEKGFDALIRAVVNLRRTGKTVALWIAGEGGARGELETLINDLDCGAYVRLLGHVADTRTFYEALDLYVLSSIREGLPNVVLEAMAMEVPVVATRVAGVPALIEDGISGVIVDPGSSDALERGIERLIAEPALGDAMRRAARLRVESKFSFERRMQKMVTIYNQLLGRG